MALLSELAADARYALRNLRHNPGFATVVIGVLALGIGANTAIFSVVNSVLLQPLPFPHADRLAMIWETNAQQSVKREGPSGPNFYDWRQQSRLFEDMAAVELGTGTVTGFGEPQQIPGMRVTTNLFSVLNVRTALGRLFTPEDGRGGRQALMVISHGFWQRSFGGDRQVIGKTVMLDLIPYKVIGVLDRDFWLPFECDGFVPWPDDELRLQKGRLMHELGVFGRMKPGVTAGQAAAELNAVQMHLRAEHPEMEGWAVSVTPLQSVIVEYIRPALIVLFCAVVFVLLIACTNVANLLLARGVSRGREVALRTALGAGRRRLLRQFLTESVVMGAIAGLIGILLASWGVPLLAFLIPAAVPIPDAGAEAAVRPVAIDWRVLAFSLGVSLLTGILSGLAPAAHAFKANVMEGLKQGSRATAGGGRRMREGLLAAEVALALVLLAGAGLMLKSFVRLQQAHLGFRADHLLTMEMELPTDTRYRTGVEQRAFFERVLEAAQSLPGVRSAALTSVLPLHPQDQRARFLIENGPVLPPNERLQSDLRRVSPSYFQTMGIVLKRGRLLDRRDPVEPGTTAAGVVDEAFVRRFFPDQDPLGRRLVSGSVKVEIVGVVGDVKHVGVDREFHPTLYVSFLWYPAYRMNLVLRTANEPAALVQSAKSAIWSIDRDQPIYRVETMEHVVSEGASAPRLALSLLSAFAITALGLAGFGIFGVVAYTVNLRSREIGIRMALGAGASDVIRLVVRQGMATTALGMIAGLAAALALTRLMSGMLYGVSPQDPLVIAGVAALLGTVSITASCFPALRASQIDPMIVLRHE
jgi:putative ABC transport system permease protein